MVEILRTGGIACGLSACALYGLADPPAEPQVLVARGSRSAVPGRHTTRELLPSERVVVDGFPAMTPARAILDSVHLLRVEMPSH